MVIRYRCFDKKTYSEVTLTMSFDLWQIKVVMDLVFNVIFSNGLFRLIFLERAERDFHVLPYFIMQTVF